MHFKASFGNKTFPGCSAVKTIFGSIQIICDFITIKQTPPFRFSFLGQCCWLLEPHHYITALHLQHARMHAQLHQLAGQTCNIKQEVREPVLCVSGRRESSGKKKKKKKTSALPHAGASLGDGAETGKSRPRSGASNDQIMGSPTDPPHFFTSVYRYRFTIKFYFFPSAFFFLLSCAPLQGHRRFTPPISGIYDADGS